MLTEQEALQRAETGIKAYLESEVASGNIDQNYFQLAQDNVIPNLKNWLEDSDADRFSPNIREGIVNAIDRQRWAQLTEAYVGDIRFGTGGIRGKMAFDRESVLMMKEQGIAAPILKGPNTLNDKVLLLKSVGVAQFAMERGLEKVVIGYDSRVRGADFARLIARLFLAYGLEVYLFDDACPYPEVTFAVPSLKADIGILISASHNDYRYNGYKLSCGNGSQFDVKDRNYIYDKYIVNARSEHIRLIELDDAGGRQLWFLGGSEPRRGFNYHGHEKNLIDMHTRHINHVKSFLIQSELIASQKETEGRLRIGFSAFHGAGRLAVPRILSEVGLSDIKKIHKLDELDGTFPCFCSDPGKEQQPDPGDPRAARIAVAAFKEEYSEEGFQNIDVLIGTDPDADRCGVVVKVPENQRSIYGGEDYTLLPADYAWALLLWYRLNLEKEKGTLEPEKKFMVMSHTTSDLNAKVAEKFGLGVMKTWVGFAMLANAVRIVWDRETIPNLREGRTDPSQSLCHPVLYECYGMNNGQRSFNVAAMEQSNGFSLLGGRPKDEYSLGEGGHVRDKDGTFAALLMAEVAAYAKSQGSSLLELLDEKVFLDPEIGLFVNYYEPAPMDGEYEGLAGYTLKRRILVEAENLLKASQSGETVVIGGLPVTSSVIHLTGKYDKQNWPGFPDEGIRFYFDQERFDWLHIRPSGTSNALRFHVQLRGKDVNKENLIALKQTLAQRAEAIVQDIRTKIRAQA